MSLFEDALDEAFEVIEDVGGEDIVYVFNGIEIEMFGVPGRSQSQVSVSGGKVTVPSRDIDWLIRPKYFVINDIPFEPLKNSVIRRLDGRTYKVLAPAGGNAWDWSDANETYYRIHTSVHATK